jgi:prepilin-type N-terminal cleavage/methylation domain-containing protein
MFRGRVRGFTLMELMLVMSLMASTALLYVSYTSDIGNVSVDAASWKVQSDIRYAQQLANTTGLMHGVVFIANDGYTVYQGNETQPVTDPLSRDQMVEDFTHFGTVTANDNYRVEFDSLGRPTMGGGGHITLITDNGATRRIYVIANTGAVVVDVLDYGSGCSCEMCGEVGAASEAK